MPTAERFAPSPTGPLHLGHAYSAIIAWQAAKDANGSFHLRIEDIDQTRARSNWEELIYEDLDWLGLTWEQPVMRQSDRMEVYQNALQKLWLDGLLYACHCNRRDILAASQAPQEGAPLHGPDGLIYPGTCAQDPSNLGSPTKQMPRSTALRLSMSRAVEHLSRTLDFTEIGGIHGQDETQFNASYAQNRLGDIVLARKDFGTSYHLSVVLDDAAQNITHVTRGADLFEATKIHVILQQLLNLPTPIYRHHKLIRDETGKRLAKRDDARALSKYRQDGLNPSDIYQKLGLSHRLA